MQPRIVVVMGPEALETLNELALPLAQAVAPRAGEIQALTPSIEALYAPTSTTRSTRSRPSALLDRVPEAGDGTPTSPRTPP